MRKSFKKMTLAVIAIATIFFEGNIGKANAVVYEEDTVIETAVETVVEETDFQVTEVSEIQEEQPVILVETGISINTDNVKKEYILNESVNLDALIVFVQYENGEVEEINDFTCSNIDTSTYGSKTIAVSYGDFIEYFSIEVTYDVESVDEYTMYASESLSLRFGPDTLFIEKLSLNLNEAVSVVGFVNDWAKIVYKGNEYFCLANELLAKQVVLPTTIQTDMTAFIFDGNVSQECQNKAIELYSVVPQNVKDAIAASGYKVVVSSNSEWTDGNAGTYYPQAWSEYYSDDFRKYSIAIYAGSVWKTDIAVIHEIGHFIDDYIGNRDNYEKSANFGFKAISSCEEWQQIYTEEISASGFPSWTNWCPEEFFAECVWKALAEPEWCQKTLPKAYEFVMNVISNV